MVAEMELTVAIAKMLCLVLLAIPASFVIFFGASIIWLAIETLGHKYGNN